MSMYIHIYIYIYTAFDVRLRSPSPANSSSSRMRSFSYWGRGAREYLDKRSKVRKAKPQAINKPWMFVEKKMFIIQ